MDIRYIKSRHWAITYYLLLLLAFCLFSCRARYQITNPSGQGTPVKLDPSLGVYIVIPEDGKYESKTYAGSGQKIASALAIAFSKKNIQTSLGGQHQSQDSNFSSARQVNAGYLVVPTIFLWEPRATGWSFRASKMEIGIIILDVKTSNQINSIFIKGRTKNISMSYITNPESLLRDPFANYINSLY